MSQHSSLRISSVGAKHRNVLKRHERVKKLEQDEKWNQRPSVYGLPKVKSLKIKVKKVKAEKAADDKAAAPAGAAATTTAAKPAAKPAAQPKEKGAK